MCPICMGTMFPAEEVAFSFCQPVAHFCHKACWNAQMEDQKLRCFVCRQREVGELELIMICETFALGKVEDIVLHSLLRCTFDVTKEHCPHVCVSHLP